MFETINPIFKVRLRFKANVRVNARDAEWRKKYGSEVEAGPGTVRAIADQIIEILDESFPAAMVGVQWQDIYYALERVRPTP
jgi:hypothetical protein